MIRRPPRSTHCISSAASDVYKRQHPPLPVAPNPRALRPEDAESHVGDRSRAQVKPWQHSDVKPSQSIADTSDLGTSEYTKSPTKNSSNGTLSTHATVDLDSPRGSNSVGAAASTCIKSPTTAPPSTGPAWRRTLRREDAAPNSSLLSAAIPTVVSGAIKKPFPTPKTIVAPRNHIQETLSLIHI